LESAGQRLAAVKLPSVSRIFDPVGRRLELASAKLRPTDIQKQITTSAERLSVYAGRADRVMQARIERSEDRVKRVTGLLEAYSYQGVLKRGYALVTDSKGRIIRSKETPKSGDSVKLTFADGERAAVIDGADERPKARRKPISPIPGQGDLF